MQSANQNPQTGACYHRDGHQREPPPYPGLGRPLSQPGFRQSYSGSETSTDISLSSCENLSSSVRQEPQGEETSTGPGGALDPLGDGTHEGSAALYREMLQQLALSQGLSQQKQVGVEVRSTNSSTFYVTGNMPPPTTAVCSGIPDNYMVNSSHGNHVSSQEAKMNRNNSNGNVRNDGYTSGTPQPRMVLPLYNIPTPPPYPASPSPTPSLSPQKSLSPKKGSSPTPHHQTNTGQYYQTTGPGHHKSVPHMGCGSIGKMMTNKKSPSSSDLQQERTNLVSSPTPVCTRTQNASNATNSQNCRTATPTSVQVPNGKDASPSNDSGHTLAQLLSALSHHSVTQLGSTSRAQRPSTAPSGRHLPAIPRNDNNSDNNNNPRSPETLEKLSAARSQPDLTHLAELQLPRSNQQEHVLPNNEPDAQTIFRENEQNNAIATNARQLPKQPLSTSSSSSSLMQYQQQVLNQSGSQPSTPLPYAQLQDCHLLAAANPRTTASSPIPAMSLPLHTPGGSSVNMSPDKQQQGSPSSPGIRKLADLDHAAIATRATQMVERLSEENRSLRQELEGYYKKVYRLQKLELEIQKVHENYETLVKHSQKQESLEKLIRFKLEAEIRKLRLVNKELKEQLEKALRQIQQKEVYAMLDPELKNELLGKDSLITKLLSQNHDLTAAREQLEAGLVAQKTVMHEQRSHLVMLESALSTARANVTRYEEEFQKKMGEEEKVSELQKALSQLQAAVEKREAIELKLRQKLEEEVQFLRSQQNLSKLTETDEGIASDSESPTSLQSLVRQLQDKEQRILALEAEVAKVMVILVYLWKQKYLEETALRHFAVDAASMPKDARIASLEQSSLETEKIIAEARNDRVKHLDEVLVANRKCAELESKVTTLQAQLAEKDTMIRVLQRHTPISRTSSISSLLGSPIHSPRPSFNSSPSPHSSPVTSPLASAPPSGASSRQNSQLDSTSLSSGGGGNSMRDREGRPHLHSKSSSTGTSTAGSSHNSSSRETSQLRELQQRLAAQAAILGSLQSGSDQLKKCMWQV